MDVSSRSSDILPLSSRKSSASTNILGRSFHLYSCRIQSRIGFQPDERRRSTIREEVACVFVLLTGVLPSIHWKTTHIDLTQAILVLGSSVQGREINGLLILSSWEIIDPCPDSWHWDFQWSKNWCVQPTYLSWFFYYFFLPFFHGLFIIFGGKPVWRGNPGLFITYNFLQFKFYFIRKKISQNIKKSSRILLYKILRSKSKVFSCNILLKKKYRQTVFSQL